MSQKHPMQNDSATNTEHPFSSAAPAETNIVPGDVVEEIAPQDVKQHRGIGAVLLLVSLVTSYYWVYLPLQDAVQSASSLPISMKMIMMTPFILIHSVTLLLFPKFVIRHLGGFWSHTPKTALGWIYLVALIALGTAFWLWIQAQFRAFGYSA